MMEMLPAFVHPEPAGLTPGVGAAPGGGALAELVPTRQLSTFLTTFSMKPLPNSSRCGRAEPATTSVSKVPQDYLERVRRMHESGGFGSEGCGFAQGTRLRPPRGLLS